MRGLVTILVLLLCAAGCGASVSNTAFSKIKIGGLSGLQIPKLKYKYSIAGGFATAISHGMVTPLDIVKNRMQTSPGKYSSIVDSLNGVARDEGVLSFFSALLPTLLVYAFDGILKYGIYENFKPIFLGLTPIPLVNNICGGLVAGIATSLALAPLDGARIKMMSDSRPYLQKDSLATTLAETIASGPGALYSGISAMIIKQVPLTVAKHALFDMFGAVFPGLFSAVAGTSAWTGLLASPLVQGNADLSALLNSAEAGRWLVRLASALCSAILSAVVSQPGDMLYTNIVSKSGRGASDLAAAAIGGKEQKLNTNWEAVAARRRMVRASRSGDLAVSTAGESAPSVRQLSADIYREFGFAGFFKGLTARMIHLSCVITSQLVLYDLALKTLSEDL
jgi:solute carrier family 25 (mitochondrial phosphate transporter), member 3